MGVIAIDPEFWIMRFSVAALDISKQYTKVFDQSISQTRIDGIHCVFALYPFTYSLHRVIEQQVIW